MDSIPDEVLLQIKTIADCRLLTEELWPNRVKRRKGTTWMAHCPFHDDQNPSFAVKRTHAVCYAGCRPPSGKSAFDCYDLVSAATGVSFAEAVKHVATIISYPLGDSMTDVSAARSPVSMGKKRAQFGAVESRHIIETYDYTDEKGALLFQVVRLDPKAFRQRRPDGNGGWIWNLDGIRRVLYRLREVMNARNIVICEGEKDVDNVGPLLPPGWAATSAPGGAGKWDATYTASLAGKSIIVLPDTDTAGQLHLDLVTRELRNSAQSLGIVLLDQQPSSCRAKDISEYLESLSDRDERARAVKELLAGSISLNEENDGSDEGNDPLDRIFVDDFPRHVLPAQWLGRFEDLAESLSVSPEGVISCALAILSGAIGDSIKVSPKPGWKTSVAVWMALVGDSGQGKTPVIRALMEGLYGLQAEAFESYERELSRWQTRSQELKKGEQADPPPKVTRYFTTDPTLEALLSLLAENPRGIIMVKDELASLVCGFNQYKPGGKGSERQQYLSIFSGSPVLPDRRHGEKVYVRNPFLALLGGVQKRLIPEILGPEAFSDGLIYRFIFLVLDERWFPLTRKSWQEESCDLWSKTLVAARQYHDQRVVLLNNEAWDSFSRFRDDLYGLMNFLPARFAGFIPKITEYALRFAGVLHFWHSLPSIPPPALLPEEIMEGGISLARFYLGQARLLLQLYEVRRELRSDQQALLAVLREAQPEIENGVIPTSILYERFNGKVPVQGQIANTRKLTALLKELAALVDITLNFRAMRWRNTYSRCLVWEHEKMSKLLRLDQ